MRRRREEERKSLPRNLPKEKEEESRRSPVMLQEVLRFLRPSLGDVILDCTAGAGGHGQAFASRVGAEGKLIALDRDEEAIEATGKRLSAFGNRVSLHHLEFRDFPEALKEEGVSLIDGIFFDLGVSPLHMLDPQRGFSFSEDGPLDMRMDRRQRDTAEDIVNRATQGQLQKWIFDLAGDHFATKIARRIVQEREKRRIRTTSHLAGIVRSVYPPGRWKIHPATRTFQALRILVNREQEALESTLPQIPRFLRTGARAVVISFHSGEDRIVKGFFRDSDREGEMRNLTKKPLRPTPEEVAENRWARSAILRAGERIR
ncbi:MAG: 16S rRNA (cytosine(1402)-N(4))-methyltransferase RsmH [Planctomycetota bacterium]|nr:16S rRNA (cytosine(1402)-N(4))-methyltransferase RsmH [Planctomycetota bacterium]